MKSWIIFAIRLYQKTLSPDHGILKVFHPFGFCPFQPSCSQYSIDALSKYGLFRGIYISARRIVRCHPWTKGGNDPA